MWTKEKIRNLLEKNDMAVARGLVALYTRQTRDEQKMGATRHVNGVGFNSLDAPFLTSLAEQVIEWQYGRSSYPAPLSPTQVKVARKRILKYAGQLAEVANGN